jgi:DNA-binding XRE family transcriptional regulator
VETRATDTDDAMRFLRELRQLRNEAGLEPAELAARAHYPRDVIVAAEAGPSIPALPVLSAYVRGCGAGLAEWEERWRSLTGSSAAAAGLPPRPAGCSGLADAGARLSAVVSSNAEVPIPDQVMRLLSGPMEPTPAELASPEPTSHASQLPAIRPAALPATRRPGFPRAALAGAVAAVIVVLGAILVLLRRKS